MNVHYTNVDVEAAKGISASSRSTGTKRMFEGSRGSATMIAALGAADWLSLAAAPTFAIMGLLSGVLGGGRMDMLCSAAQDAPPLSGMVPMYLLMSGFHSAPWLKLISGWWSGAGRS